MLNGNLNNSFLAKNFDSLPTADAHRAGSIIERWFETVIKDLFFGIF